MSSTGSISTTITGGIQDVSALLPLLGTEQCEDHASSALTKGYLYAAATPMSLFGSLGLARAGIKAFVASLDISSFNIRGALMLSNMGFQSQGTNIQLIMLDENDKDKRHLVETRLDQLLNELHVDKTKIIGVKHKSTQWNVLMVAYTAFFCLLSVIPYIYLNVKGEVSLPNRTRWTFPAVRAMGGFLTVTTMQAIIQRRIIVLSRHWLSKPDSRGTDTTIPVQAVGGDVATGRDLEKGLKRADHKGKTAMDRLPQVGKSKHDTGTTNDPGQTAGSAKVDGSSRQDPAPGAAIQRTTPTDDDLVPTWFLLSLLLLGVMGSVVGYIGCFSVVQSAQKPAGALSWLGLESALSLLRMYIWGLNPESDDAPPLELVLELDQKLPLPTCNLSSDYIENDKMLPLTRARPFLGSVTSFAGLVERFEHPDLTLYYTLTRSAAPDIMSNEPPNPRERVLYITIFDHKERTTRVYTRDATADRFYSRQCSVPAIDLTHGVLDAQLGMEIDRSNDPIACDDDIRPLLENHYRSIMDEIHFTIGERHRHRTYTIENKWTLKMAETISERGRKRLTGALEQHTTDEEKWDSVVERGKGIELNDEDGSFERDRQYLKQGQIESMRQSLDVARGKWIEHYMRWMARATRERFGAEKQMSKRVNPGMVTDGEQRSQRVEPVLVDVDKEFRWTEDLLVEERCLMELMWVYEAERWAEKFWEKVAEFIGNDEDPETARLLREWRANCWKKLDANIRAMRDRMLSEEPSANAEIRAEWQAAHEEIRRAWQSVIGRFLKAERPSHLPALPFDNLDDRIRQRAENFLYKGITLHLSPLQQQKMEEQHREMMNRMMKEIEDVEARLNRGLQDCDQFWSDEKLVECRYTRSQRLALPKTLVKAPLVEYSRALKQNQGILYVDFNTWDSDDELRWITYTIGELPWLTSISISYRELLFDLKVDRTTPLFIDDPSGSDMEYFLDNDAKLAQHPGTFIFFSHLVHFAFAVSFVGPTSGSLILRIRHRSSFPEQTLVVKGTSFQLPVSSLLTVDDITLYPSDSKIDWRSFNPGTRKHLIIQVTGDQTLYSLDDVQLLDELENRYDPQPVGWHL